MRTILVVSKIPHLCEFICQNDKFVRLQKQFDLVIDNVRDPQNNAKIDELLMGSEIAVADPSFVSPLLQKTSEVGMLSTL